MEDSGIDSGDTKVGYKNEDDKALSTSDSSVGSTNGVVRSTATGPAGYSSRQLQRRLEQRIENARRLHLPLHQQQQQSLPGAGGASVTSTAAQPQLIPIQRLPIPHTKEQQPLVEWDTDDSEEEVVNFFPQRPKDTRAQQELTDTFSIEDLSLSGGEEDEEDDLHLVPPLTNRYHSYFRCCPIGGRHKCSIM